MGNGYLQIFSEFGHVGPRVILSTFRAELEIVVNWIIMSIRMYIYGFARLLISFELLGIELSCRRGFGAGYGIA